MIASSIFPLPDPTGILSALVLLFALVIGHAFADFPLQGDFLSHGKNRNTPAPKLGDGRAAPPSVWVYLMSAHCLIHGGFVWVITGSPLLGFSEFICHFIIDVMKCEGKTSFQADQWLHVATKVVFVVILWLGLV